MHFQTLLSAAALIATAASSAVPPPRSHAKVAGAGDVVNDVMKNVIVATDKLGVSVSAFDGDALKAVAILEPSAGLLGALTNGTLAVKKAPTLTLGGTLKLIVNVLKLKESVTSVTDMLISKKALFDKAMVTPIVSEELSKQYKGSKELVDAINTKIPPYIPSMISDILVGPVLAALKQADEAFKVPASAGASGTVKPPAPPAINSKPPPVNKAPPPAVKPTIPVVNKAPPPAVKPPIPVVNKSPPPAGKPKLPNVNNSPTPAGKPKLPAPPQASPPAKKGKKQPKPKNDLTLDYKSKPPTTV